MWLTMKVLLILVDHIEVWTYKTSLIHHLLLCKARKVSGDVFVFITYFFQIKAFLYDQYDRK